MAICVLLDYEVEAWRNPHEGHAPKFPDCHEHRHVSRGESQNLCHGDTPQRTDEEWRREFLGGRWNAVNGDWRAGQYSGLIRQTKRGTEVRGRHVTHSRKRCDYCKRERENGNRRLGPFAEWVGRKQIRMLFGQLVKPSPLLAPGMDSVNVAGFGDVATDRVTAELLALCRRTDRLARAGERQCPFPGCKNLARSNHTMCSEHALETVRLAEAECEFDEAFPSIKF